MLNSISARMPEQLPEFKKTAARSDANTVVNPREEEKDFAPTSTSIKGVIRTRIGRFVHSTRHADFNYSFSQ